MMPEKRISFRHRIEYALFKIYLTAIKLSPLFLFRLQSKILEGLFKIVSPRHIRLVESNLQIAFPEMEKEEITVLRRKIYKHFAFMFTQILHLFVKRHPEKILPEMEVKNPEILKNILKRGRGVIMFSAHFGNWELLPFVVSRSLGIETYNVAREMDNLLIERQVSKFREFMGSRILYKKGSIKTILKVLKDNQAVGMIIDQNTIPQEGVVVEFFSRPVTAIPSVSQLHLKMDIPILPVFLHYEPDRIVCDILEEVSFEKSGDFDRDVQQLTQDCHAIIEKKIRQHPEQWFWFHNRWKARPQGEEHAQGQ